MVRFLTAAFILMAAFAAPSMAQDTIQEVLQEHRAVIEKSSRKTIAPAIDAIANSGLPSAQTVLQKWQSKEMWQRKEDGLFFYAEKVDSKTYSLFDFEDGAALGDAAKSDLKQLKPNSGIRAMIGAALVQFQLNDPDPVRRSEAILAIQRDGEASHLAPLRASIASESDPDIKALKEVTERLLTISYDTDDAARVAAIQGFNGALSLDARAALNPVLTTKIALKDTLPEDANIKDRVIAGSDALPFEDALAMIVDAGLIPAQPTVDERKDALLANITDGKVGGVAVADLDTQEARDRAYMALVADGKVPAWDADYSIEEAVKSTAFVEVYAEPSKAVTDAAAKTLKTIDRAVGLNQTMDLALDGLSLASIYFLAAIGLASPSV